MWLVVPFLFSLKSLALKSELKTWNKKVFGNVHLKVDQALAALESVQHQISNSGSSDALVAQELQAQIDLQQALSFQESL